VAKKGRGLAVGVGRGVRLFSRTERFGLEGRFGYKVCRKCLFQ
jgi:hypothetical protein